MLRLLQNLDRRWIFLAMGLAVALPMFFPLTFPEEAKVPSRRAFETIQSIPEGTRVLLAFDFDPASEPELGPMATSLVRQCAIRKLKMCFITLWPLGPQQIGERIRRVIEQDFPSLVYGTDYVDLGYQAGNEAVMKQVRSDFKGTFPQDARGTPSSQLPLLQGIRTAHDFPLLIAISAGNPGGKEWVQYVITPTRTGDNPMKLVIGCTGVQVANLRPYFPGQLDGLIGAIKGAAEYETLVDDFAAIEKVQARNPQDYREARRRMGPQVAAHILMVSLIVLGNVIFFLGRRRGATA